VYLIAITFITTVVSASSNKHLKFNNTNASV